MIDVTITEVVQSEAVKQKIHVSYIVGKNISFSQQQLFNQCSNFTETSWKLIPSCLSLLSLDTSLIFIAILLQKLSDKRK